MDDVKVDATLERRNFRFMARWKKYTKLILNTFGVISYSER